MAVTSGLITQDESGNTKLHPYLVALVKNVGVIKTLWNERPAMVFPGDYNMEFFKKGLKVFFRVGNARVPPAGVARLRRWCVSCLWSTANILIHRLLTAPLPPIAGRQLRTRSATTEHLHPEPRVQCVELHRPAVHSIDVIFVHGLYGSLGNTWRQGDWRPKYKIEPNKIPLIDPSNTCECETEAEFRHKSHHFQSSVHNEQFDIYKNIKIISEDDIFTERFYNNTLLDQCEIVDNYELQANFVRDLFKKECDSDSCDEFTDDKCKSNLEISNDCECTTNEGKRCDIGCGCVCDDCYSSCWPRDWIKVDYPEARIISVNYTSDPYLWRPLWVKGNKRLRLHERAEQMTRQLLELGVGRRPIIWVGHSKGGLFVKQIYCQAYEAYLKMQKENSNVGPNSDTDTQNNASEEDNNFNKNREQKIEDDKRNADTTVDINSEELGGDEKGVSGESSEETSLNSEEDIPPCARAGLWSHSAGFMFYSVPHRGSPLADIKTPITARSIELLEISKDCALVLSLQERWLQATAPLRPAVRSLVETTRTLMSVLWLRIVSVSSADAGIGTLYGVSVDHREICKPASRHCTLYTELMSLMRTALNKCRCQ